jgi:hypothetical protein
MESLGRIRCIPPGLGAVCHLESPKFQAYYILVPVTPVRILKENEDQLTERRGNYRCIEEHSGILSDCRL